MLIHIAAYHFTPIDDPAALAASAARWAEAGALKGTVLVAAEGINLCLAGHVDGIRDFVEELRRDTRFADIRIHDSHCEHNPFGRLKVKVKPEVIAFRQENTSPLPMRAPSVAPDTLARWLAAGCDDRGRPLVLLDTRNREEVAHGTFDGALTLDIDNFTDLPEALLPHREALADATVVSFCTGGIRCEKAALWMRAAGMDNVLQLDGGILGYFSQVGGSGYTGNCFVFDGRIAVDSCLRPVDQRSEQAERAAA